MTFTCVSNALHENYMYVYIPWRFSWCLTNWKWILLQICTSAREEQIKYRAVALPINAAEAWALGHEKPTTPSRSCHCYACNVMHCMTLHASHEVFIVRVYIIGNTGPCLTTMVQQDPPNMKTWSIQEAAVLLGQTNCCSKKWSRELLVFKKFRLRRSFTQTMF